MNSLFQHLSHLWRRLLSLLRREKHVREMEEEMRFHLEMRIEQNLASGMAAEEAHYAARRQFGNQTWLKEVSREMWSLNSIETLIQDLRYGARMLLKKPGFTLIAVLTLALGIGANTAIFSIVNATLLRPLPFAEPDRLVMVSGRNLKKGLARAEVTPADWLDYRTQNRVFDGLAAFRTMRFTVTGQDEPELLDGALVSTDFFPVLGLRPFQGRTFSCSLSPKRG